MLDTDSVSYAIRGKGDVGTRILKHKPSELCISSITLGELRFGAHKVASKALHKHIDTFTASVVPQDFDRDAAEAYGRIAADLAKAGTPIGAFDTMIAAHALAKKLTLVTNNVKHFRKVSGLKIENWTEPDPDSDAG
jgi:tRNA(fMet)-specific endonuclease VapC